MPSLTLTDPDMILPFDGSERQSQTPSPPSQLVYLSNLNARYNPASSSTSTSTSNSNSDHGSGSSSRKKSFSRSAWTHDDLSTAASRRLSDIGEELSPAREVGFYEEDQRHAQYTGYTHSAGPTESWPAVETEKDNASSSSSTVSAGSARTKEKAREPASAQNQSQDQDQSSASVPASNETNLPDKNVIASAAKGKGPGEEFSSAILSSEAERILDNAKKRLTVINSLPPPPLCCGMLTVIS